MNNIDEKKGSYGYRISDEITRLEERYHDYCDERECLIDDLREIESDINLIDSDLDTLRFEMKFLDYMKSQKVKVNPIYGLEKHGEIIIDNGIEDENVIYTYSINSDDDMRLTSNIKSYEGVKKKVIYVVNPLIISHVSWEGFSINQKVKKDEKRNK